MKKYLLGFLVCGLQVCSAYAGTVNVSWGNLDQFTDIQPGHDMKDRFRERLTKEFEQVFAGLAKKLPDSYTLELNVTDLDLAGEIRPGSFNLWQIRIMKPIYWPRMNFTYQLKNEKQEVIVSGTEELRDMDYLGRIRMPSGNTEFEFEERMIQVWFKTQLISGHFPSKESTKVAVTN